MKKYFLIFLFSNFSLHFFSQTDPDNGDWKEKNVFKTNTGEADVMVRQGDIDNLGFGWDKNFNPFSGKSTVPHAYPWERDTAEILGYDMILTPSGIGAKAAPCGGDGYSSSHAQTAEKYGKTTFPFQLSLRGIDTSKIKNVLIQMFVDDFQAKVFCANYEVYLNSKRAPFIEKTINTLQQTGPIGKLITITVPKEKINEFKKGTIELVIDDNTTSAEDGFAIDFIKVLINPKVLKYGTVSGIVINESTNKPMANVNVQCGAQTVRTNVFGQYKLVKVPSGLALISVEVAGKPEQNFTIDVEENAAVTQDLMFK